MNDHPLAKQSQPERLAPARPFSHIIPRRRNAKGVAEFRTITWMRPLVTLDPDALLDTASACTHDPEEGRKRLPWLKAKNAVAASDNAVRLRAEIEDRMARENDEARTRLASLEPKLEEAQAEMARLEAELAAASAPLGLRNVAGRGSLAFEEDEPASLEELAGRYNLPPPEERASWAYRTGFKLLAAVGGGTVFGISLGLLSGKLELLSLGDEWPWLMLWAALGMAVMALVGAALYPLSQSLGDGLYRLGRKHAWLPHIELLMMTVFLVGLVIALVLIESKVEQLGLFKAIGEQSSLRAFRVSQRELAWVSMMLVIPTVSCYVVLGLREGRQRANLAHLEGLRGLLRQKVWETPSYAAACSLLVRLHAAQRELVGLSLRAEAERSRIRTELSRPEKERLEDLEMDAVAASWEAEDAVLGQKAAKHPASRVGFVTWWRKVIGHLAWRAASDRVRDVGTGDIARA